MVENKLEKTGREGTCPNCGGITTELCYNDAVGNYHSYFKCRDCKYIFLS